MDCSQVDNYLAGRLSNGETQAFEAHAQTCADCAKAVARKKAIERAQSVLRRNEVARGDAPTRSAGATYVAPRAVEVSPSKAVTVESPVLPMARGSERDAVRVAPPSPTNRRPVVIGVVAIVLIGGAILFWPKKEAKEPMGTPTTTATPTPTPTPTPAPEPEPAVPAPEPAQQQAAPETPPPAPEPKPTEPKPTEPKPTEPKPTEPKPTEPKPTEPKPTEPKPTEPKPTEPVTQQAAPSAPVAAAASSDTKEKQPDLPAETDIETLASVVSSPRCGPAISALQARVAKNRSDARSWALLVQCYGKRHRWKNALSAYDHVLETGDSELVESLQSVVDAAHAALTPATAAPADADATAPATP